jgi:hypothetical protein
MVTESTSVEAKAAISTRSDLEGSLAVLLAAACWGTSGIFGRLIGAEASISALALAFWRDLTTFVVLLVGLGLSCVHPPALLRLHLCPGTPAGERRHDPGDERDRLCGGLCLWFARGAPDGHPDPRGCAGGGRRVLALVASVAEPGSKIGDDLFCFTCHSSPGIIALF